MILIDTSVWIDFLRNTNHSLSDQLTEYLENGMATGLSAVFGELLQGVKTADEENLILDFWNNIPKVDESHLFVEAGKISRRYKLMGKGVGLTDCYILAAAIKHHHKIWTLDRRLTDALTRMQI